MNAQQMSWTSLVVGLLALPGASADTGDEDATSIVQDWFEVGCPSPFFVVSIKLDRVGVLVGQGHFGPDGEYGCLYRGPVYPGIGDDVSAIALCAINKFLSGHPEGIPYCL